MKNCYVWAKTSGAPTKHTLKRATLEPPLAPRIYVRLLRFQQCDDARVLIEQLLVLLDEHLILRAVQHLETQRRFANGLRHLFGGLGLIAQRIVVRQQLPDGQSRQSRVGYGLTVGQQQGVSVLGLFGLRQRLVESRSRQRGRHRLPLALLTWLELPLILRRQRRLLDAVARQHFDGRAGSAGHRGAGLSLGHKREQARRQGENTRKEKTHLALDARNVKKRHALWFANF